MGKFNSILVTKAKEEEAENRRQEKLKKEAGITADDVAVRRKGPSDYLVSAARWAGYVLVMCLVFVGLVTLISPDTRGILMSLLPF